MRLIGSWISRDMILFFTEGLSAAALVVLQRSQPDSFSIVAATVQSLQPNRLLCIEAFPRTISTRTLESLSNKYTSNEHHVSASCCGLGTLMHAGRRIERHAGRQPRQLRTQLQSKDSSANYLGMFRATHGTSC